MPASRLEEHLKVLLKDVVAALELQTSIVTPAWVRRMEDQLKLVLYEITPRTGVDLSPLLPPTKEDIQCSVEGCGVNWQTADACLLRVEGQWYCRNHHPKRQNGAVQPVGWTPDAQNRAEIAASRTVALEKLTPAERRLVNPRMV